MSFLDPLGLFKLVHQPQFVYQMEHPKLLQSPRIKQLVLFFIFGIMNFVLLAKSTAEDEICDTPIAGLLCISDCATCPVICSPPPPPPPPQQLSTPPPSPAPVHHSPPQTYYFHSPPPSALPRPLLPPPSLGPPPSSYVAWGGTPPPAPWVYAFNNPTSVAPPGMGQRNYTYPYYNFYASKASFVSVHSPIALVFLFSFHAMVMLPCW